MRVSWGKNNSLTELTQWEIDWEWTSDMRDSCKN